MLDVVPVNTAVAGSVQVLTGNGAGVFTSVASSLFLMGVQPNHVVVADLDKDGNGVAAATVISTRKSDGAGGFGNAPTLITLTLAPMGPWTLARRPLIVGFAHGLAGSGALTGLVIAAMPTLLGRLLYITMFGAGSTLGMALLSGALGLPLARLAARPRLYRSLSLGAGVFTIAFGVYWTTEVTGFFAQ